MFGTANKMIKLSTIFAAALIAAALLRRP